MKFIKCAAYKLLIFCTCTYYTVHVQVCVKYVTQPEKPILRGRGVKKICSKKSDRRLSEKFNGAKPRILIGAKLAQIQPYEVVKYSQIPWVWTYFAFFLSKGQFLTFVIHIFQANYILYFMCPYGRVLALLSIFYLCSVFD